MKRVFAWVFVAVFALAFCVGCHRSTEEVIVPVHTSPKQTDWQEASADLTEAPSALPSESATPKPTAAPTAEPTAAPTEEYKGSPDGRKVYLTFDDGPTAATATTLDILASYGIKATFFTVGQFVDYNPNITKRIADEGHLLACHTYSHDFNIIYQSPDAFLSDVAKWRRAVISAVGYDAGSYCLRFPGGSNNSSAGGSSGRVAYLNALHAAGYRAYDWNLGFNDKWIAGNTEGLSKKEYFWQSYHNTYEMWVSTDKPLIFLIHDDVPESVELLPALIEDLIAKGCSFGTVNELGSDYLL